MIVCQLLIRLKCLCFCFCEAPRPPAAPPTGEPHLTHMPHTHRWSEVSLCHPPGGGDQQDGSSLRSQTTSSSSVRTSLSCRSSAWMFLAVSVTVCFLSFLLVLENRNHRLRRSLWCLRDLPLLPPYNQSEGRTPGPRPFPETSFQRRAAAGFEPSQAKLGVSQPKPEHRIFLFFQPPSLPPASGCSLGHC